uniref:Uncharacterized protein n=1 Tax=Oryza brachyantha TaxID=4533 RepID=J3LQG8_ORYBR
MAKERKKMELADDSFAHAAACRPPAQRHAHQVCLCARLRYKQRTDRHPTLYLRRVVVASCADGPEPGMSSSRRWASASGTELPAAALSPIRPSARRSPVVSRPEPPAAAAAIARTVWPSSSSSSSKTSKRKASPSPLSSSVQPSISSSSSSSLAEAAASSVPTLADHLLISKDSLDALPALSRQRSCTELPRFADADAEARQVDKSTGKAGRHAIGRSMRFLPSTRPAGVTLTPGRVAPSDLRRLAGALDDAGADVASSGSECSDASRGTPRTKLSKPHSPLLPRTNSTRQLLGSSNTQWALSPGRRSGSPLRTLAAVPELRGKKSLIGLGWGHLFSRRKASGTEAAATLSSPASRSGGREIGHQMKMAHCRLLQWWFANAKAEAVSNNKLSITEVDFMGTWARISELQGKVARRRVLLEKEKLKIKLNSILSSQMVILESWGLLESKYAVALASIIGCTQAAVCKLPLTNGAKVSLPSMAIILQQALDLTTTTMTTLRPFTPLGHDSTLLIAELVVVAREEHALLQECLELLGRVSALQVEEESLRCH